MVLMNGVVDGWKYCKRVLQARVNIFSAITHVDNRRRTDPLEKKKNESGV